jgi:hypothetical protein
LKKSEGRSVIVVLPFWERRSTRAGALCLAWPGLQAAHLIGALPPGWSNTFSWRPAVVPQPPHPGHWQNL